MKKPIITVLFFASIAILSFVAAKLISQKYQPPIVSEDVQKMTKDCLLMSEINELKKHKNTEIKIDSISSLMKSNCDTCYMYVNFVAK